MKDKILITGIGGPAGKSSAFYFREKGFFVTGTDIREVPVKADSFHLLPLAGDGLFQQALLGLVEKERPSLFIPTVTEELVIVSRLKPRIEAMGCTVFISNTAAVEIANDKLKTALFMEKHGIPAPRTFGADAERGLILKELGLPILAKPCFGRGGRGVKLHKTAQELHADGRDEIVFQEFIPGEEFDANLFIGSGGVEAAVALKKTELKDGIVGNALRVERVVNEKVTELSRAAALALSMEGPLDFDIRFRKDGTPALLEINARVGGNVLHAVEVLDSLKNTWKRRKG